MSDTIEGAFNRRQLVRGSMSAAALAALPASLLAAAAEAEADKAAVLAQIPKMHAENLRRLQEWIALPSIAAENRNYPQGPEYMAQLARAAGFTGVKLVSTAGTSRAAAAGSVPGNVGSIFGWLDRSPDLLLASRASRDSSSSARATRTTSGAISSTSCGSLS